MGDGEFITKAWEAWGRILNMDGGSPQNIAAGMWAGIYADRLLKIAAKVKESA